MKKICLITCYNQPDYIRARTFRAAFSAMDDVELIVVKNTHMGVWRYFEVLGKIIAVRLKRHPDMYFLTFRGYEMLLPVRLLTLGKPFVFDEFINFVEWVVYEHHKLKAGSVAAKIFQAGYKIALRSANLIVSDTVSHARYSAQLMKLPPERYMPLIVSTDETVFSATREHKKHDGPFRVFYYGSMLPLQGVDTIIDAMCLLKGENVELTLIGGKEKIQTKVAQAQKEGVAIVYKKWVPFNELPHYIAAADVCLGGPFGGTLQAQYVIGGKTYQFLRMGCPVIIGKNDESHLWTDKKDALLVPQADPQALAKAVAWSMSHPDELEKIGALGQKLYEKSLSNRVLMEQLRLLLAREHIL